MQSLATFVSDYFGVECGSKQFLHIYGCSLKYLTKTISAGEFHKRLKKISDESIKTYRLELTNSGYYLLNVKMWLIQSYANKRNPKWNPNLRLISMKILNRDKKYLPMFLNDSELRDQVKAIVFQLGGSKFIPSISTLKKLLVDVMQWAEVKLKPLINNILWTKLRFLIQCGSIDIDSIRCELKTKIVQTFYWLAPYRKENINHWVMSMIKPIKNYVINLINFHTTKKRNKMVEEEDGRYRNVDVPIDLVANESLTDDGIMTEKLENTIVVNQLLRRYGVTKKRIKAFKLMSGIYDLDFTNWLRSNRHISKNSNFDNTDFQEQTRNESFLRVISEYVKLEWVYFKRIILHMRKKLEGNLYSRSRIRIDKNIIQVSV